MKKYEDKVIPESIKKILVETTCDMCKKDCLYFSEAFCLGSSCLSLS
jgi:hypothetical protein